MDSLPEYDADAFFAAVDTTLNVGQEDAGASDGMAAWQNGSPDELVDAELPEYVSVSEGAFSPAPELSAVEPSALDSGCLVAVERPLSGDETAWFLGRVSAVVSDQSAAEISFLDGDLDVVEMSLIRHISLPP